ncbi:uncharacterized protein N7484_006693 [Penicillium longicatenatum]|uniref:uncharacterized protein n=1 Tax=Penicillium longicatenatum TaxID=1561947 RepID=UPI002547BD0A|nr:uncharacterized protein N7484_006693 [Penicillium longicatenatum]KAJ5644186.1 hypothetical protein N7484_006693 [Penicillium longicatenatum]
MRHPKRVLGLLGSPLPRRGPVQSWDRTLTPRFQSSSSDDTQPARPEHANLNRQPVKTTRRWPKKRKEASKVPIGVDSLGEPGEIFLVPPKDAKARRGRKHFERGGPLPKEGEGSLSSILDDLADEASITTPELVWKRLESLRTYRPKQKLPARSWENLLSSVESSFTLVQLSEYLAQYNHGEATSENNIGTWRPGTSVFLHHGQRHGNQTKKSVLVERILRECWQLSIMDEVGQLDLSLPPLHIKLLLTANDFSFDEVASLHKSSIDITQSLGLVRITGPQTACESTREVISDATTRIREEEVGFDFTAASSRLTPSFIDWVCQAYSVAIDQQATHGQEKLLFLIENKQGAEDARRTLGLAAHDANPTPRPFSTYLPASEPANIYDYTPEASANWFDRQKSWFRWAMPAVQTSATEPQPTPFFDGHQTRLSDELLKLLRNQTDAKLPSPGGLSIHESVTATVGKCLFGRKPAFDETVISASQLGKLSLARTFVPDIPRIKPFLDTLHPIHPEHGIPIHVVRLTPFPGSSNNLPELDVEFVPRPAKSSEDFQGAIDIKSIKSILDTKSVDYLLPETGLDLRFTRTLYSQVSIENIADPAKYEELLKSIRQPLHDTFISRPSDQSPTSLPAFGYICLAENPFQAGPAKYMFPPLNDARGAAAQRYDFDGRQLSYRFYESGPFLALRSTEVSLDMAIPQDHPLEGESQDPVEQHFHSFYNAACDMAFRIHKARYAEEHDG